LVDLGGNRLGCCDDSRPDHRLGQIPTRWGRDLDDRDGGPLQELFDGLIIEQANHVANWQTR
jgi:hypothetical protein